VYLNLPLCGVDGGEIQVRLKRCEQGTGVLGSLIAFAKYPQGLGLRWVSAQDMVVIPRFLREENEKGIR
jgi:hypothetical protein